MEAGFFHFTLQGLAIFTAIFTLGFKAIKLLRKIDRGFSVWQWQHTLMWRKFVRENRLPDYPGLDAPHDWEQPPK